MECLGFITMKLLQKGEILMPPAAKGLGPLETRNDFCLVQRSPIAKGCRTRISQKSFMKAFPR
jgi:hypothetical protein